MIVAHDEKDIGGIPGQGGILDPGWNRNRHRTSTQRLEKLAPCESSGLAGVHRVASQVDALCQSCAKETSCFRTVRKVFSANIRRASNRNKPRQWSNRPGRTVPAVGGEARREVRPIGLQAPNCQLSLFRSPPGADLPHDAPDQSLRIAILPRGSVRRQNWFHTKSCNGFCEDFTKHHIATPHQETG